MTIAIIITVILGIIFGFAFEQIFFIEYIDFIMDIGLCLLLLFVGIDIGRQKDVFTKLQEIGKHILIIPIMIGIGSIVGGLFAGSLLHIRWNEGCALGSGFGWYSLSSVIISSYSSKLSAIAFLSNVMREVIAIICIPFIAKCIGNLECIAPAGATAMDTTLPIISRYTDSRTAIIAFVSGVILSSLVPILVPLFLMI